MSYTRNVVSVREIYRTKRRNEPVGEATLICGHVVLVDMNRPAKRRKCGECARTGRATPPRGKE